jgi:hypothetical protein
MSVGGGCGSTAGEVHGLQVAQQVQEVGEQGGSLGAATGGAGATTGSDSGDTVGAGKGNDLLLQRLNSFCKDEHVRATSLVCSGKPELLPSTR